MPPLVLHHHLEQIRAKGKLIGGAVSPSAARTSASDAWTATSQPGSVVKVPNSRSLEHQYRRVGRSHRPPRARQPPLNSPTGSAREGNPAPATAGACQATAARPGSTRTSKLGQAGARNRSRGKAESRARAALRSEGNSRGVSLLCRLADEPLRGSGLPPAALSGRFLGALDAPDLDSPSALTDSREPHWPPLAWVRDVERASPDPALRCGNATQLAQARATRRCSQEPIGHSLRPPRVIRCRFSIEAAVCGPRCYRLAGGLLSAATVKGGIRPVVVTERDRVERSGATVDHCDLLMLC